MNRRSSSIPTTMVEFLRLCVVAFSAALGSQSAGIFGSPDQAVIGVFDVQTTGVLLGAGVGYVGGGLIARLTLRSLSQAEQALSGRSAEQLLAGFVGASTGLLVAAAMAWPVLMLAEGRYTVPMFLFILITIAVLGYRIGINRRDAVLAMLGGAGRLGVLQPSASALPKMIDTSVAIDARVVDVVRSGFLHGRVLVPEPVLGELQGLADSADDVRRAKGRRGIATLESLRQERGIDLEVIPDEAPDVQEVDAKLVQMCTERGASLLTLDTNLARVADLAGCAVLNLHSLALALRPPVLAGESLTVTLNRSGKEPAQAVGYLDDGTMVVVDRARHLIGSDVRAQVTSVLVTANGRMVFARLESAVPAPRAASVSEAMARVANASSQARTADPVADDQDEPDRVTNP